ncbi:sugar ABC transporter ATP-binding protein [Nakamurella deserti]|uniref:sugar ABC transporter ATP-binding protein n=1 Tax=Nakamurella deserti TaxID=2164074 RepID=UPI000DBE4A5C|nr:sugar ABC transporter ATP-binding protein [Nakamurella deserti]
MTDRTATGTSATSGPGAGLRADGIVKRYAGVPALSGVTIAVRPGEVVGLVGHNGAGKSTLLKSLAGAVRPDEGTISVDGQPLALTGPAAALAAGISTVYQELSLLPNLTVTQNVFLNRELRRGGQLDTATMRSAAADLVKRFELDVDVDRKLSTFPVATRQLLEIAVATQRGSRFLLLDEPTTSLEGEQVDRLLEIVKGLARDTGLGVLLIDHKMDELYAVAHSIVALVDGKVRISGRVDEIARADIVRAIAGEEAAVHLLQAGQYDQLEIADDGTTPDAGRSATTGPPVAPHRDLATVAEGTPSFTVSHLRTGSLQDVSIQAFAGRVLGLYGLIGSGRTELLRAVVGLDQIQGGSLTFEGRPYLPRNPSHAQQAGVVYLTEERKTDGIVPKLDSAMNVVLPILNQFTKFGALNRKAMARTATEYMDLLRVRGNRSAPVVSLSGGNQQKVLLARALAQKPRLLLLDEPTKGVDIGVKSEIHRLLRSLAHDQNMTVIVVSSEEEEILDVSDDVATFSLGRCDGTTRPASELSVVHLRQAAWDAA